MINKLNRDFSSIEDFVWDEDFRNWVLNSNANLDELWNNWLVMNPNKREDAFAAKEIIKSMSVAEVPISNAEIEEAIQNILSKLDKEPDVEPVIIKTNTNNWFKYAGIAASLLVAVSIALMFFTKTNHNTVSSADLVKGAGLIEWTNNGAAAKQVLLADGSKITLQKNAKIRFQAGFNNSPIRKVYLTGKAKFEVAKNPKKPFFVYTDQLVTKVIGTKFIITSNDADKNVTVEVISGVVSVFPLADKKSPDYENAKNQNSLKLTRNQKAIFSKTDKTLAPAVIEQPVALNEAVFNYAFFDEPVKNIFRTIEENYGIRILYNKNVMAGRTFTADLSKTTMYDKLNIICKAVNARYEIINGNITVYTNHLPDKI
jgi:transmembrane sensor